MPNDDYDDDIHDLPGIINEVPKPTVFADDTNIIITHSNLTDFKEEINIVFQAFQLPWSAGLYSIGLSLERRITKTMILSF